MTTKKVTKKTVKKTAKKKVGAKKKTAATSAADLRMEGGVFRRAKTPETMNRPVTVEEAKQARFKINERLNQLADNSETFQDSALHRVGVEKPNEERCKDHVDFVRAKEQEPIKISEDPDFIKKISTAFDEEGEVKVSSDNQWFDNWGVPKRARNTRPIPFINSGFMDEVADELYKQIQGKPEKLMDELELDVANKTRAFLKAKRDLLESKQKLSKSYDKFLASITIDKDVLLEEEKNV